MFRLASIKFCISVVVNLDAVVSIENTIRRSSSKYVCIPRPYVCVCVCIKYLTRQKQNVRAKPQKGPPPPPFRHTHPHKRCYKAFKPTKNPSLTMDDSIETKAKYAYADGMLKATGNRKGLYKHKIPHSIKSLDSCSVFHFRVDFPSA